LERSCPLPDCVREKKKGADPPPALAELAAAFVPHGSVATFARRCLKSVFPVEFWGSRGNETVAFQHLVPTFVQLRRYEHMANKTLLHGFRTSSMKWLLRPCCDGNSNQKKKTLSRAEQELLQRRVLSALRWVFHHFILPVLRSAFYVTDSEFQGKQVLYYRRPVWSLFRTLSMKKLSTECDGEAAVYTEMSEQEATRKLADQGMGLSLLRLLPKATGVRPIATLCQRQLIEPEKVVGKKRDRTRSSSQDDMEDDDEEVDTPFGPARKRKKTGEPTTKQRPRTYLSTNAALRDAFAVLTYEYSRNPTAYGAGLRGLHEFHGRYRQFLSKLKENGLVKKSVYFVSVDIRQCYDNIQQEYLLELLDKLLKEQDYLIQRYSVVHPCDQGCRVMKKHGQQVGPPEEFAPFQDTVQALSDEYKNAVFVEGQNCVAVTKEKVMKQLREHITSHMVVTQGRFGNRYFVQSTGIPQGSILSSMLCNFYYGNVEQRLLGGRKENSKDIDLLVRMIDDFMFVTTNRQALEHFLSTMHRGDLSLGAQINKEKTRASVDASVLNEDGSVQNYGPDAEGESGGIVFGTETWFPWCGMLFHTETGQVQVDYSRFFERKGGDTLTVERVSREGEHFATQMKAFVRPRCMPVLYDPLINTTKTVVVNFYQMMAFVSIKMVEYLRSANGQKGGADMQMKTPFLLKTIECTIIYAFGFIQEQLARECGTDGRKLSLKRPVALWLGWRAFYDILSRAKDFRRLAETLMAEKLAACTEVPSLRSTVPEALRHLQLDKLIDLSMPP
jgi:telomerase reverse transcriptase